MLVLQAPQLVLNKMTTDLINRILIEAKKVDVKKIIRISPYDPCTYEIKFSKNLKIRIEDCNQRPGDMPDIISMKVTDKTNESNFEAKNDSRIEKIYYILEDKFCDNLYKPLLKYGRR